jgi:uncharacterized protein YerC
MTMMRDGHSHQEIGQSLGVSERTISRVAAELRRQLLGPAA